MAYFGWLKQKYLSASIMVETMDEGSKDESWEAHVRHYHDGEMPKPENCGRLEEMVEQDALAVGVHGGDAPNAKVGIPKESKRREEMRRILEVKRGDLSEDDKTAVLDEIDKFKNAKERKLALHWFIRGSIKLPEDAYKVEEAVGYAERGKVDPFSYSSPMELIESLRKFKPKERMITVEDLKKNPLMSDYREEGFGVETFKVDESQAGQALMRRVIDSHWGEDANPWCLLARDKNNEECPYATIDEWWQDLSEGERKIYGKMMKDYYDSLSDEELDKLYKLSLLDRAEEEMTPGASNGFEDIRDIASRRWWRENIRDQRNDMLKAMSYWNHYSGLPKRVAFKDGRLLAFMATESLNLQVEDDWTDEVDKIADIDPEKHKKYEEWLESRSEEEEDNGFIAWLENSVALEPNEKWWDRMDHGHKGIPVGDMKVEGDPFGRWKQAEIRDGGLWLSPGYSKGVRGSKGYREWYDNGLLSEKIDKDGRIYKWDENGDLESYEDVDRGFSFVNYKHGITDITGYNLGFSFVYASGMITAKRERKGDAGWDEVKEFKPCSVKSLSSEDQEKLAAMVAKMEDLKAVHKQGLPKKSRERK